VPHKTAYRYTERMAAREILIDDTELARLLVEHNISAQKSETFVLKRVDEDFFEET
jgi:restriction system protein